MLLLAFCATATAADALPVALERARRALFARDDHGARDALQDAEEAAGATRLLVPDGEIARLHYYDGVRAWNGGLQSQAMAGWRRAWQVGGFDPSDDGLLDDEGMAVLRALKNEGGGESATVLFDGDERGAVVLVDGRMRAEGASLVPGAHLVQVRCPDGAVSSAWVEFEGRTNVALGCGRHQIKKGAPSANEGVLAADADEDLVRVALFGAYLTDAAMRLSQLGPAPEPPAPTPEPPPEPPAPEPAPPPPVAAPPVAVSAGDCFATWSGAPGGAGWSGGLPKGGGVTWLSEAPVGDLKVRLEGEGTFGVRLRSKAQADEGLAVRVLPGRVQYVLLPDTVMVEREVATAGPHVLQVDLKERRVQVRLDGALVLGGSTVDRSAGTVAVEVGPGGVVGSGSVCR